MDSARKPLFKGTLTHPTTKYVGLPVREGCVGAHIAWLDATSSATITLEFSSIPSLDATVDAAGDAWDWVTSGVAITGPTAAAAGASLVNVENVRQHRARLKIVTAANTAIEVWDGTA
jgi:hypothetical protein